MLRAAPEGAWLAARSGSGALDWQAGRELGGLRRAQTRCRRGDDPVNPGNVKAERPIARERDRAKVELPFAVI